MKPDAAFAILRDANPVPDAVNFMEMEFVGAAFLSATKERSERMETLERMEQVETPVKNTRRWQPLAAVAAFVIVLAIGAAVVAVGRSSSDVANVPAPPFDNPQESAEAYTAAMVAGDYVAYQALFAPGGTDWALTPAGPQETDAEHMEGRFAWVSTLHESVGEIECEPLSELGARCSYTVVDPVVARVSGDGSLLTVQNFTIDEEGRLESTSVVTWDFSEDQATAMERYNEWVVLNRPEAVEMARVVWGSDPLGVSSEEIAASVLSTADEYVAAQEG